MSAFPSGESDSRHLLTVKWFVVDLSTSDTKPELEQWNNIGLESGWIILDWNVSSYDQMFCKGSLVDPIGGAWISKNLFTL